MTNASNHKEKSILTLLFITLFINIMGFSLIIPIKPQLIMDILKNDLLSAAKWGGYLLFGYALGQFLMSPLMAVLSGKYGRKKILLFSIMASSIDFIVMAFINHIELLLLTRFLLGVLSATIATVNLCIIDITPPKKRAINFSIVTSAIGLGLMVGPFLGGILGEFISIRSPLYIGSLFFLFNLILVYLFVPETLKKKNEEFDWKKLVPFGFLKFSNLPIPLLTASFLYQLAFHSFTSIWSYYMIDKFNWGALKIGLSLLFVGLTNFFVQNVLARFLIPKFGERKTFLIGAFFVIPTFYAYATVNIDWLIFVIIAFGSFGSLMKPCLQSIMSSFLPYQKQGELMAAITSINGVSLMIGPLVMTQTFSYFKANDNIHFLGAPFILSMILTILATSLVLWVFSKKQTPLQNFA